MFKAFSKNELRYYNDFHQDKDYEAEAKALPLKGKTVLEIGSGTGLMTRELRKLGYEVTTVEPTDPNADFRFLQAVPDCDAYDNVLALYDVLNYLSWKERPWIKDISRWTIEMWNPSEGVKFFTYKVVGGNHVGYLFGRPVVTTRLRRIRLGFRFWGRAHLLYIYWGKGLCLAYHKLYL